MKYKVIFSMPIMGNTAVTLDGNGNGLKNGISINSGKYKLLSVGISDIATKNRTTVLIKGKFADKEVFV